MTMGRLLNEPPKGPGMEEGAVFVGIVAVLLLVAGSQMSTTRNQLPCIIAGGAFLLLAIGLFIVARRRKD
jgi:hypothetical protein